METLQTVKNELLFESENLSNSNKDNDPILNAIGILEVEPFSDSIDNELYG